MNRVTLIQLLMKQKGLKNYLEIGVFNGHVFFRVKSAFKIAVDPEFQFDALRKIGKTVINPYNLFNKYFSKTSDDFFAEDAPGVLAQKKIDIALVDGMHEYGYALRDVENMLTYLSEDGVIIMHDCNPATKEAGRSYEEWKAAGSTGQWNGDVWKAIVHLRSLRKDIDVFVLDCDYGLGIISRRKPENNLNFSAEQIQSFTYEDFNANRAQWINLKRADYSYEYFKLQP
ncbi:MAG: class I SAM-dependent methyltransferase [Ginsengibacter sp.]